MNTSITQLTPELVWKHFHDLTQIPRPSGHEAEVVAHIKKFADDHGLENTIDETGNIIVRKKASPGREQAPTVILQSHVDMVPQKNSDKVHDFLKDPIETHIDGEWVKANNTTLGADNGIGIAATLAVLEAGTVGHGPLEALFTISEETGMDGAFGLKSGILEGSILLNLDSEEESELFIGCAGGVDVNVDLDYREEGMEKGLSRKISVSGLKGGHSGLDINLGRANANQVIIDLIGKIASEMPLWIHSFSGGNLRNAIPREAEAIVNIREKDQTVFEGLFEKYRLEGIQQFSAVEKEMRISVSEIQFTGTQVPEEFQEKLVKVMQDCPAGVISMSKELPGIVQTSNNISIVNIQDGKTEIKMLLRSSSDKEKDQMAKKISELFEQIGARSSLSGAYPGWLPNNDSQILKKAKSIYRKLFGEEAKVKVIHAGLECGIIAGVYPHLDMVSFGPTIKFPHSPDEKVHIRSVGHFWEFLVAILEAV